MNDVLFYQMGINKFLSRRIIKEKFNKMKKWKLRNKMKYKIISNYVWIMDIKRY